MRYIVYDKNTGHILRRGSCPEPDLLLQAQNENEVSIECNIDMQDERLFRVLKGSGKVKFIHGMKQTIEKEKKLKIEKRLQSKAKFKTETITADLIDSASDMDDLKTILKRML